MTQIHHVEDMFTSQKPRSCRVFSGEAPDNGTSGRARAVSGRVFWDRPLSSVLLKHQ
jgi:hypothetical protein